MEVMFGNKEACAMKVPQLNNGWLTHTYINKVVSVFVEQPRSELVE